MLPGFKTMLLGGAGSGKTHAIRTLAETGITSFIVFTENGMRTIGDYIGTKVHYKFIPPAKVTWKTRLESAKKINSSDLKMLANLTDINRANYQQYMEVLLTCNEFVCDCCNKSWGDVIDWKTDRALVLDSLTGLSTMAMDLVVGSKPVKSLSDWLIAMDNIHRELLTFTNNTECHFVLTSHLERELDETTGMRNLMPSTLGQKLAPKIPPMFDDVVLCKNTMGVFSWATLGSGIELKFRNLPPAKEMPPTFAVLLESWEKAGGEIVETTVPTA